MTEHNQAGQAIEERGHSRSWFLEAQEPEEGPLKKEHTEGPEEQAMPSWSNLPLLDLLHHQAPGRLRSSGPWPKPQGQSLFRSTSSPAVPG